MQNKVIFKLAIICLNLVLVIFLAPSPLSAATRYQQVIFTEVEKTSDIIYGS